MIMMETVMEWDYLVWDQIVMMLTSMYKISRHATIMVTLAGLTHSVYPPVQLRP